MSKFVHDLNSGKIAERKVLDLLRKSKFDVDFSNTKDTDLTVQFTPNFTIEVKYDIYERRSGNIAIEVYNTKSNKPSGLYITPSDLWCHVLSDSIWITSTDTLKRFVLNNEPHKIITNAGDGNAMIYLYKSDLILIEIFHRIDILGDIEIGKIIQCLVK